MDLTEMGGTEVYVKYLALSSKNYANVLIKSKYNSSLEYYAIDGPGNWGNKLFHYCTIDTLKSIMQNKQLRFSDVRFLNDTTEFMDAIRLLRLTIKEQKDFIDDELYNILTDEDILDNLENYFQRYSFKRPVSDGIDIDSISPICRVYTCSFSMHGDLLPMWTYYANGAGGVSICFEELEHHMKLDDKVKLLFGKVWYHEEDKKQCIEALLKDIRELFPQIPDKKYRKDMLQRLMISAMNSMRIFMKNENYSPEEEYRAVLIVPEESISKTQLPKGFGSGHFNRGNTIIPYIDVPFALESISDIVVGPGINEEFSLVKMGLQDWLLQLKLNNISIYKSAIPMRKY